MAVLKGSILHISKILFFRRCSFAVATLPVVVLVDTLVALAITVVAMYLYTPFRLLQSCTVVAAHESKSSSGTPTPFFVDVFSIFAPLSFQPPTLISDEY